MPRVTSTCPETLTIAELARVAGVSERVMYGRKNDGRVPARADGSIDLWALIRRGLAGAASDQKRSAKGSDALILEDERARLAKEQADAQEMKNAVARGDLIPRTSVVTGMEMAFSAARARLLGIPSKAAPLLMGKTNVAEARDLLAGMVNDVCGELAATRVIADPAVLSSDGAGGDGGDGDLGAAAELDGERVG